MTFVHCATNTYRKDYKERGNNGHKNKFKWLLFLMNNTLLYSWRYIPKQVLSKN